MGPVESRKRAILAKYAKHPLLLQVDELIRLSLEKVRLLEKLKTAYALELEAKEKGNSPLSV